MNKQQIITELRNLQVTDKDDPEKAHGDADDLLCAFLTSLGYKDVVEEWQKVLKWYA